MSERAAWADRWPGDCSTPAIRCASTIRNRGDQGAGGAGRAACEIAGRSSFQRGYRAGSLPTPDIVKAVALGPDGIVAGNRATVLIDLSTTGPGAAKLIAKGFEARKITLVDAPVSGGIKGAVNGTLAVMVSCPKATYDRVEPITTQTALAWARLPIGGSRNYLSRRLRAVRSFARYLHALDPACEIPPIDLLPASKYRPAPYLYSDREIVALMSAARALGPPLRAATMETLIGLLACTGLRIGEAIRLDRDDFDPTPRAADRP